MCIICQYLESLMSPLTHRVFFFILNSRVEFHTLLTLKPYIKVLFERMNPSTFAQFFEISQLFVCFWFRIRFNLITFILCLSRCHYLFYIFDSSSGLRCDTQFTVNYAAVFRLLIHGFIHGSSRSHHTSSSCSVSMLPRCCSRYVVLKVLSVPC